MNAAAIVHPELARATFERSIRPLLDRPDVYQQAGIRLVKYTYPFLDVELDWHRLGAKIILRVDGTDYNYRPVSGHWIDSAGASLGQGNAGIPHGAGFHLSDADNKSRSWFCFLGWREYHDHTSHQDRSWNSIRCDTRYSVLQIIQQLLTDLNSVGVQKT